MRLLTKAALTCGALSSLATYANPLTYPTDHKWHFTVGAETGVEGFHLALREMKSDIEVNGEGSAYSLAFNQSFGYGKWFYIQAKESGSVAIAPYLSGGDQAHIERSKGVHFLDADIRAYFPFRLSCTNYMTLGPLVGFGVHMTFVKRVEETQTPELPTSKVRLLAPMAGIFFGFEPTDTLSMRTVLAFEFPNYKHRLTNFDEPEVTIGDWEKLHMHRLGLNASIDVSYKLGRSVDLTGSLNYLSYSLVDALADESLEYFDSGYLSRLGMRLGARWSF